MIIGILKCDSVIPEYLDQFNDYPYMFQSLLEQVDPSLEFIVYDVQAGIYPENISECDGYIITGSKDSVYDQPRCTNELQE